MKNLKNFPKMPLELQRILHLFDLGKVGYLLFKCEHVIEGQNRNLDLLLRTADDYAGASTLLEQQGYVLYLDEKVEKYKKMYVFFDGKILSAIHLHREVAWHGVKVLDKEKIFQRAAADQKLPSPEDSLLIHAAHALFENFKVKEYQRVLLDKYKAEIKDWQYLDTQLFCFGWKDAFYDLMKHFSISPVSSVSLAIILRAYSGRLWKKPKTLFTLSNKILKVVVRRLSWKRRGYLISLIGMNGSGKSTTKEVLLDRYLPLTSFVAGQYGYYFGLKHSIIGKALSSVRGKDMEIFEKVSTEKVKKFDPLQEALFLYIYGRFLWRYAKDIYPHLRAHKLVITDRYFYDLYGQYPYSKNSLVLKVLPIPRPDALVVLDAVVETAMKRDKFGKAERILHSSEKLAGQRRRYLEIAQRNGALVINTENALEENISTIINNTWKKCVR